jgi:WD40 repeat protein
MIRLIFSFIFFVIGQLVIAQTEPRLVLPVGHLGGVTKIDSSPNGRLLLTEDLNSDIIVIDSENLIELQRHNFGNNRLKSSSFLNDTVVLSLINDSTVSIWNFSNGQLQFYKVNSKLSKIYIESHGLYCIDNHGSIFSFELLNGVLQLKKIVNQYADDIYFKSKNELFVVRGATLTFINLENLKKISRTFNPWNNVYISALAFNNKGNLLIGFESGVIIETDNKLKTEKKWIQNSDSKITFLYCIDDTTIISGSYNFSLTKQLADRVLNTIYFDDWIIGAVQIDKDLFVCSWNGELVKINPNNELLVLNSFESRLKKSTAFQQKNNILFISYNDGTISSYNLKNLIKSNEYKISSNSILTFDVDDSCEKIISATKYESLLFDLKKISTEPISQLNNTMSLRFFKNSNDFVFSNDNWLIKKAVNKIDSIELDSWYLNVIDENTILASGTDKIAFVLRDDIRIYNFPNMGYISIAKRLNNNDFIICTSENRKIITLNPKLKVKKTSWIQKQVIEVEPFQKNKAVFLSEDGNLYLMNTKNHWGRTIQRTSEYGAWDFLLDAKKQLIVFPCDDLEGKQMKIDIIDVQGNRLKSLKNVGGQVICIANSYHSIDFNELDSNQVIFIVSDGTVRLWDINKNGDQPITQIGFEYYNLVKNLVHDNPITDSFLESGLLKLPIPGVDTLTFMSLKDGDWLVHDSKYRFDGSPGAIDKLYFTCGLEVVELNQVKDSLYVPNLVERYLNGEKLEYLPRLENLKICGFIPLVKQIDTFTYQIIPRNGGIGDIEVYLNGVQRLTFNSRQLKFENGIYLLNLIDSQLKPFVSTKIPLTIKVIAKTADNSISSRGVTVEIESAQNQVILRPSLHAIMIGVDEYKDEALRLKYAAKDANDLQIALQLAAQNYFNIDDTNRVFFYNLTVKSDGSSGTQNIRGINPDRGNIIETLKIIRETSKPEDILLLFFAGHGEILDEGQLILLTSESTMDNFQGMRMTELLTLMSDIPAGKRIFILDACHSGAAINNLDLANLTGKRDVEETKRESIRLKELDKLASKSGFAIITASGSDQKALELPQYEHGLLTYSLLSSLVKSKSAVNEQNELILEKWFIAAEEEMMILNKDQNAEKMVPVSFNLGIIDEEVRNSIKITQIPMLKIAEVINEGQFLNDIFPYDNYRIREKTKEAFDALYHTQNKQVLIIDDDSSSRTELIIKYSIKLEHIHLKCHVVKNGFVFKTIEKRVPIDQLEPSLNNMIIEIYNVL